MKDKLLWEKINDFKLDDEHDSFTFTKRQARDNKRTYEFSKRVVTEYKRFIYLCCAGYGQITPSDAVDQAWHLHLTYTKSYWIDLCKNTLNKEIHHNPTKGGGAEREKFSSCYDQTFKSYQHEFGSMPPSDIWPTNKARFSDINFKRVNLSDYWLIKKPNLSKPYLPLFLLIFVSGLFIQAENADVGVILGVFIVVIVIIIATNQGNNNNNKKGKSKKRRRRGGGSDGGFFYDDGIDSGCSTDSGCSGCSGCGGGD